MFELITKEYIKGEHAVRYTEFTFFRIVLFRRVIETSNSKNVELLTPKSKRSSSIKGFKQ